MKIAAHDLRSLTSRIFVAGGCEPKEGDRIAAHLVEANLVGHDSHGVIRVRTYIDWLLGGQVSAGRRAEVVFENDAIAIVDGHSGFGQSIGEEAVQLGISKCENRGCLSSDCVAPDTLGESGTGLRWQPGRAKCRSTLSIRRGGVCW